MEQMIAEGRVKPRAVMGCWRAHSEDDDVVLFSENKAGPCIEQGAGQGVESSHSPSVTKHLSESQAEQALERFCFLRQQRKKSGAV